MGLEISCENGTQRDLLDLVVAMEILEQRPWEFPASVVRDQGKFKR